MLAAEPEVTLLRRGIMRFLVGICALFASISCYAGFEFLSIYNVDGKCELRKHDDNYFGTVIKKGELAGSKLQGCNIFFTKSEFESAYRFCALSGFKSGTSNSDTSISCKFSIMTGEEKYYFFSSPGIATCQYMCEKAE